MSFRDCVNIRLLGLPASLINIGLAAFVGCENLMMIEIPSNVQYMENPFVGLRCPIFIKSQYFSYKNGILLNKEETCIIAYLSSKEHYVLPSKIIKISNGAFWRCEQLKSIQMNDVVKEIGNWAFCACTHLRSLIIIRKTKCFRILERNAIISKTKRNFSRLYPTPQKIKKNRPASPERNTFEGS